MTGPSPLSRRSFLAFTGGAVLLVACGSGDDSEVSTSGEQGDPSSDGPAADDLVFTEVSAGVVSSDPYVSNDPQRFAFAVLAKEGFASGKPARVALAPPGTSTIDPSALVPATLRADGLPERRGVYTVDWVFDQPGNWVGVIEYDGESSTFLIPGSSGEGVREEPLAPAPGMPAIVTPSATLDDPLGVDPICTLDPPCPLHEKSLADVIGAGKPVAVQFSTPARCQTQYCGPVLDTLVDIVPDFESEIEFVHVEIFPDLSGNEAVDAVRAWGLPTEPWMFGIDAEGTVVSRLDGAFDRSEMREMLEELTA